MNKQTVFRLLIAFAIVLLPFFATSPVEAAKPERVEIPLEDVTYPVGTPCGYDLTAHLNGKLIIQMFEFNEEDGSSERSIAIWGAVKATYTANGKELVQHANGPYQFRNTENGFFEMSTGTMGLITIPGHGVVGGNAGQYFIEMQWDEDEGEYVPVKVKMTGVFDKTDWGAICEYFDE